MRLERKCGPSHRTLHPDQIERRRRHRCSTIKILVEVAHNKNSCRVVEHAGLDIEFTNLCPTCLGQGRPICDLQAVDEYSHCPPDSVLTDIAPDDRVPPQPIELLDCQ